MTIDLASLQPLFAPRSVAVIGASSDPLKIGGRPVSFLKDWKFAGRILPVNPRSKEIQSLPAFASVGEVDGPVDLAICAVPGEHAMQALQDCAKSAASMSAVPAFLQVAISARQAVPQKSRGQKSLRKLRPERWRARGVLRSHHLGRRWNAAGALPPRGRRRRHRR